MKLHASTLLLSATDLSKFSACRRATLLDREVAYARSAPAPYRDDPAMRLLKERGQQHEARYREVLEQQHGEPAHLVPCGVPATLADWEAAAQATLNSMRAGHRILYQAPLWHGAWYGRADFLERVDHQSGEPPSELGD